MSVIDWILIGLGIIAVGAFAFYEIAKFKADKKEMQERKANGENPQQIKKTKEHKKSVTEDDTPFED